MSISILYLVASTLVATPFTLVTWAFAWVKGTRAAQRKATAITLVFALAVVGCSIKVVPQLPDVPEQTQ